LWLEDISEEDLIQMPQIQRIIDEVKKIRESSSRPKLAKIAHLFAQITQPKNKNYILIPRHSSENREYIPM
jgi:hypothetical protein